MGLDVVEARGEPWSLDFEGDVMATLGLRNESLDARLGILGIGGGVVEEVLSASRRARTSG